MSFTLSWRQVFFFFFPVLWQTAIIRAFIDCHHDLTSWLDGHVTVDISIWLHGRNVFFVFFFFKRKTGDDRTLNLNFALDHWTWHGPWSSPPLSRRRLWWFGWICFPGCPERYHQLERNHSAQPFIEQLRDCFSVLFVAALTVYSGVLSLPMIRGETYQVIVTE